MAGACIHKAFFCPKTGFKTDSFQRLFKDKFSGAFWRLLFMKDCFLDALEDFALQELVLSVLFYSF